MVLFNLTTQGGVGITHQLTVYYEKFFMPSKHVNWLVLQQQV